MSYFLLACLQAREVLLKHLRQHKVLNFIFRNYLDHNTGILNYFLDEIIFQ